MCIRDSANRALTHKAGANFSVGFRFLPKERRQAVYAAYAWCRAADDAVDEGDPAGAPRRYARRPRRTSAALPSQATPSITASPGTAAT